MSLGVRLLEYHSGQWSAVYSVGSCIFAGIMPKKGKVKDALSELRMFYDVCSSEKERRKVKRLARELKTFWLAYND